MTVFIKDLLRPLVEAYVVGDWDKHPCSLFYWRRETKVLMQRCW